MVTLQTPFEIDGCTDIPRQAPLMPSPGCSTVVGHANAPNHVVRVVVKACGGQTTMSQRPFALSLSQLQGRATEPIDDGKDGTCIATTKNTLAVRKCEMRGQGSREEPTSVYHYINECTHAGMRSSQRRLQLACLDFIRALAAKFEDMCEKAVKRDRPWEREPDGKRTASHHKPTYDKINVARPVLKGLIAVADSDPAVWDNMYMKSMLYRYLLCVLYTMMAAMAPDGTLNAPAEVSHTGHVPVLDIIQLPNTEVLTHMHTVGTMVVQTHNGIGSAAETSPSSSSGTGARPPSHATQRGVRWVVLKAHTSMLRATSPIPRTAVPIYAPLPVVPAASVSFHWQRPLGPAYGEHIPVCPSPVVATTVTQPTR